MLGKRSQPYLDDNWLDKLHKVDSYESEGRKVEDQSILNVKFDESKSDKN